MITGTPATAAQTLGSKTQNGAARGGVRGLLTVRKKGEELFGRGEGSPSGPGTGAGECPGA